MNTTKLELNKLHPFAGHPYKVHDNEEMDALVESIRMNGILTPLIVRPLENGEYEIISGHRRSRAAKKVGLVTVPAIVIPFDKDSAAIAMVDSNLHREHLLPSEKAFAYRMKLEAMRHQGRRTDSTSTQVGRKSESAELIGEQSGESKNQVRRYVRLTKLIPEILQMVDEGKIALTPAVELSYLTEAEQRDLLSVMECDEVTPSLSQAQRLHRMSLEQRLSEDEILQIMSEVKGNQVEYVKVPAEEVRRFFRPGTSMKQMADAMLKAMDFYCRHMERVRRGSDER